MNIGNNAIKHACKVGYRTTKEGKVFYRDKPRKCDFDKNGRLRFGIRDERKKMVNIPVHRFQGYQKFGDDVFIPGLQIRHLDNNYLNNHWDNLELGTQSDNMMDIPSDIRLTKAKHASSFIQKEVIAGGLKFPSYCAAARYFGISDNGIRKRIQLGWKGYIAVET